MPAATPRLPPLFWLVAGAVLAVALLVGITHDHVAYLQQWTITAAGGDPWTDTLDGKPFNARNAYGPLHLVFVPLAQLHPLLPKAVFAAAVAACFAMMIRASQRAGLGDGPRRLAWLALLFPLSPLVVLAILFFGINDIIPAVLIVGACVAVARGGRTAAGILIGLAALLKFYPLLFAGFLVSRGDGRLDLRVPLVALAVFVAGMAAGWAIWGAAVFSPLQFSEGRPPKMLSILRLLDQFDGLRDTALVRHLLDRNGLYVLAAATLVALHGWLARLEWDITLLVGILAVFAVYKVGHAQFYVTWIAVQGWILAGRSEGASFRVARGFLPVAVFLSLYQVIYYVSSFGYRGYLGGPWYPFRFAGSVPFLLTVGWCVWRTRADLFRPWHAPSGLRL